KVASLGGFIGRKSDGDPGWQTLWRGLLRLFDMISGAELIKNCG
ncbi:MAG TPA: IS4 family transposase, partial [Candidatus Babeliales bacterium]|nr:IS4 family transposase [Candidatus Babeliales bacterium]